MTTDAPDLLSTATATSLFVAGLSLGAVYALNYTRLGRLFGDGARDPGSDDARTHVHTDTRDMGKSGSTRGQGKKNAEDAPGAGVDRKRRRRRRGKGVGARGEEGVGRVEGGDGGVGAGRGEVVGGAAGVAVPTLQVVPGDFEGRNAGAGGGSPDRPPAVTAAKQGTDANTQKKKTKTKKQKQKRGKSKDADVEDKEAGSETGKEMDVARIAVHGPRSGDSTDASMSLSPSLSGDALSGSSRGVGMGNVFAPLSQPHAQSCEIRPSLSFDTDSSWTHVNRRRLKASKSIDGQARGPVDTTDMTSSDLTSTASDSPVAERLDNVTVDMRGARADLAQRTLAEKLVQKPKKTDVDDMLEQPDVPTLARVMRVQPRPDETPVPGFSWEDYGDVVEESVLVHDADEEDEGEWGVVKSRNRTRPSQTTTTAAAAASASTSSTSAVSETLTKKQRQNARKRELAKADKAQAEAVRLQGLAKHKRELERFRIIEQSRQGGKLPSGGMQATVDDRGKLVWE